MVLMTHFFVQKRKEMEKSTRIIDLTVGQLEAILEKSVNRDSIQTIPIISENEIGGLELAMEITGYSARTIYTKVSLNEIPYLKRGKPLEFSRNQLENWMKNRRASVK
jgi:hypothetical protein